MPRLLILMLVAGFALGRADFASAATPTKKNQGSELIKKIREELKKDQNLSSQAQNMEMRADGSDVTIRGTVADEIERARVETLVKRAAGDNKLKFEITVQ